MRAPCINVRKQNIPYSILETILGTQARKWGRLIQVASGGMMGGGNKRSSSDNISTTPVLSGENATIR